MQDLSPAFCDKPIINQKPENIVCACATHILHYKDIAMSAGEVLMGVKKC